MARDQESNNRDGDDEQDSRDAVSRQSRDSSATPVDPSTCHLTIDVKEPA